MGYYTVFLVLQIKCQGLIGSIKTNHSNLGRGKDKDILRVYPRSTGNRISRNEVHESGFFISFFGGFFGKLGLKTPSKEYISSLFFPYCLFKERPPALLPSSFQFFMLKSLKVSLILPLIPQNQPGNPLGSAFKYS